MHTDAFAYFDAGFLAIAHRGGANLPANVGRENTVAAFAEAAKLGITHFETDVHASADGEIYAFHDDDLSRLVGNSAKFAELSSEQIDALRVGGEPIPRLADLLDAFPEKFFNIDIKAPGAIVPLVQVLRREKTHDRVCVASFSDARLARFRSLAGPSVATSMSPREVAVAVWAPHADGIVRWFARTPGLVAQVPRTHRIGPFELRLMTQRLLEMSHSAGKHVHVWTIDDSSEMEDLITWGVDGIITDRPDTLLHVRHNDVTRSGGISDGG